MKLLTYRLAKGLDMLPFFVSHPARIPALFHGVSPGRLISLDVAWLREAGIRTVIDVGANTGQFATAVHEVLPDASIHSFEPLEDCFVTMVKRLGAMPGFHAYQVALGNDDATVDFNRSAFSQSSSVLPMASLHREAFAWSAENTTVKVPLRRLDEFAANLSLQPETLLKVDVQGYEDRVLLGGENVVRACKYVILETSLDSLYEGQASFEQIYRIMGGFGFHYAGNVDQLPNPLDGRILQADALFVRDAT
jgi:FkbM family methyltransferase